MDNESKLIHHHGDEGCTFCNELAGKDASNFRILFSPEEMPSRIIYETEDFVVLPGLGPIGEIYLLILPKEPYISIASLPLNLLSKFTAVKNTVFDVLQVLNQTPIAFEHGPSSKFELSAGCCVEHAHMHICVTGVDILDDLLYDASLGMFGAVEKISPFKLVDFTELAEWVNKKISYLYYQDHVGNEWGFPVIKEIESQYLRKKIAAKLNMPDPMWDWFLYPNKEKVRDTWNLLYPYFRDN